MPLYTRFIQVGRVATINRGEDSSKVVVVLEVVDHNRLMVEGPTSGVRRQLIKIEYVNPTDIVIPNLPKGVNSKFLKAAFEKAGVAQKFGESNVGKKLAKHAFHASATDFQRHQAFTLKKKRNAIIAKEFKASSATQATQKA